MVTQKSTYIDEINDIVKNLDIATTRTSNLETLLAADSFKIQKWIFSEGKVSEVCLAKTEESEKVLGLTWSLEKDVLSLSLKLLKKQKILPSSTQI